jgi:hypothetical protein
LGCILFGLRKDEVTREWGRLHNKELYGQHYSPSIIRVIKSKRLKLAGNVARMEESRSACRVLVGKPEKKTTWKTEA